MRSWGGLALGNRSGEIFRHRSERNDGAGIADHDSGQTMTGGRGRDRIGARQTGREIGGRKVLSPAAVVSTTRSTGAAITS